jgi:hypothetical protein
VAKTAKRIAVSIVELPETDKYGFWSEWWEEHYEEYESSLPLHHDPQF